VIQTGPFGSQLHEYEYQPEGTPVIMPKDIRDGRVLTEVVARVSEQTANRLTRHKLRTGAIVLPRRGEITKRAFITAEEEGWLCGTGCLKIELNGMHLIPKFLYFYMDQDHVVRWLEQHAVGTTMLNLSAQIVAGLPIRCPAPDGQRTIADILSRYDDLIENNRRRMALLENAARLLYREWFVHLRFAGYEHTRVTDGVPDGWERKTAFDTIQILSGGTPSTSNPDYWAGEIPFYTPKDAVDGVWVSDTERCITELGLSRCNSRLYPAKTVFISARGTVGKLNLAERPMAMSQSCYALVGKGHLTQEFLYCAMEAGVEGLRQQASGAVFDAIIIDTFKRIPILVPSRKIVSLFSEFVVPAFGQLRNLAAQNRQLRAARDLLLPKLMSGELPV
jgi:type I restriction enzyme S subunit